MKLDDRCKMGAVSKAFSRLLRVEMTFVGRDV